MKTKKYQLLESATITTEEGTTLYRIQALRDVTYGVKKGYLGGYVQSEDNLSHEGECWVGDESRAYENARVTEDAQVRGWATVKGSAKIYQRADVGYDAIVRGEAEVYGEAQIGEEAEIYENAKVYGDATVYGKGKIRGHARVGGCVFIYSRDIVVDGNSRISGNITIREEGAISGVEIFEREEDE